jgi:hypothetical protein
MLALGGPGPGSLANGKATGPRSRVAQAAAPRPLPVTSTLNQVANNDIIIDTSREQDDER